MKFAFPSLRLGFDFDLVEVPPSPRPLKIARLLMGRPVCFAALLALGMSSIALEIDLPHLMQTASATSAMSLPGLSPEFFFNKANLTITQAGIREDTRSQFTQNKISILLQNEEIQNRLASKDQQEQIKLATQQQVKQLLDHADVQTRADLSEAEKEAEYWRNRAATAPQSFQPARPPEQRWYESAFNNASETIIWGFLLFGYLVYILRINEKPLPSVNSGLASLIVIFITSIVAIAGFDSTALLTVEAFFLAGIIYSGIDRKARVPEMLISAPYIAYRRISLAVGLIAIAGLAIFGILAILAGFGVTSMVKHWNDESSSWAMTMPYFTIPATFILNFVFDLLVALAASVYLTSLAANKHIVAPNIEQPVDSTLAVAAKAD